MPEDRIQNVFDNAQFLRDRIVETEGMLEEYHVLMAKSEADAYGLRLGYTTLQRHLKELRVKLAEEEQSANTISAGIPQFSGGLTTAVPF